MSQDKPVLEHKPYQWTGNETTQTINEPPQAGQGLATAPSPEGHAAGPASGSPDDDHEVLFALKMSLEHDEHHQATALRTWLPRIEQWYKSLRNLEAEADRLRGWLKRATDLLEACEGCDLFYDAYGALTLDREDKRQISDFVREFLAEVRKQSGISPHNSDTSTARKS